MPGRGAAFCQRRVRYASEIGPSVTAPVQDRDSCVTMQSQVSIFLESRVISLLIRVLQFYEDYFNKVNLPSSSVAHFFA